MTTEEIVKIWDSESQAVNDCIIEILESYMEVLNLFEATMNRVLFLAEYGLWL